MDNRQRQEVEDQELIASIIKKGLGFMLTTALALAVAQQTLDIPQRFATGDKMFTYLAILGTLTFLMCYFLPRRGWGYKFLLYIAVLTEAMTMGTFVNQGLAHTKIFNVNPALFVFITCCFWYRFYRV